jgi:hypothetical protein
LRARHAQPGALAGEYRPGVFLCAVSAVNPGTHQHLFKRTYVLRPGAGSSCFRVDSELDLTFSFLSSGQVEKAYRIERIQRLCDLVITSMTE